MSDRPPSPARRAALLKLLEDWEAGRTTEWNAIVGGVAQGLWNEGFTAQAAAFRWTLTPAGLAAARAVKGEAA